MSMTLSYNVPEKMQAIKLLVERVEKVKEKSVEATER